MEPKAFSFQCMTKFTTNKKKKKKRREKKLTENSSSEKLEIIVKMNLILIRKLQNYH